MNRQRTGKSNLVWVALAAVLASGLGTSLAMAEGAKLVSSEPVLVRKFTPPSDKPHRLPSRLKTAKPIPDNYVELDPSQGTPQAVEGAILLGHPLRKGITNANPGFYGISNYVDQDMAAPDMLLDYNCGERTYDLDDGFNHNGIDYFNFPFSWIAMDQDASIAVAAADGEIVYRNDGENDRNCSLDGFIDANEIIIEHADGSATVYTHLKKNSVTSLGVGDMVQQGDYLGVVGSSGFSTGPHLHFGVYDSFGNLVEPHEGACNDLNFDSWWQNQEPYYVPSLNMVSTHSAVPEFPPCPSNEIPHYADSFSPGDTAYFGAFFRDLLRDELASLEVRDPNGVPVVQWNYAYQDGDHEPAVMLVWGIEFPGNASAGAYTFRVNYGGKTEQHTFYINSGPPGPANVPVANNAANGLFFDPSLDGEGFNFVTTASGTIIYFYGSDSSGNRLWLISDLIPGKFGPGTITEVTMYESTGGTFGSPVPSTRGLSVWGVLILEFSDCNNAEAVLSGVDGNKVSQLIKLAGVAGTSCTGAGTRADAAWSGLWYALALEGEGYNVVVAPNGVIIYFYGFKSNGKRLWLISDLISEELQPGVGVQIEVYEAVQGSFANPVPSSQLVQWGTLTITVDDCGHVTIVLNGDDGSKNSSTVRLAGIIGLECAD